MKMSEISRLWLAGDGIGTYQNAEEEELETIPIVQLDDGNGEADVSDQIAWSVHETVDDNNTPDSTSPTRHNSSSSLRGRSSPSKQRLLRQPSSQHTNQHGGSRGGSRQGSHREQKGGGGAVAINHALMAGDAKMPSVENRRMSMVSNRDMGIGSISPSRSGVGGAQSAASLHSTGSNSSSAHGISPGGDSRTISRTPSSNRRQSTTTKMLSGWGQKMDANQFIARKQSGPSLSRKASAVSSSNVFRPVHEANDGFTVTARTSNNNGRRRQGGPRRLHSRSASTPAGLGLHALGGSAPRARTAKPLRDGIAPWIEPPEVTVTVVLGGTPRREKLVFNQEATLLDLQQKIEKLFKIDRDQQRLSCDDVELYGAPTRRIDRMGVDNNATVVVHPTPLELKVVAPLRKVMTFSNTVSIMSILELKCKIEMESGVVVTQQRLGYLEQTDLPDNSLLVDHDLVNGATIVLTLWDDFTPLYGAVVGGEVSKVVYILMSQDKAHKPSVNNMRTVTNIRSSTKLDSKAAASWLHGGQALKREPSEVGWAVLYLSAHFGDVAMVKALLGLGENGGGLSPHGNANRPWPGPGRTPYSATGDPFALPPASAFRSRVGTGRTPIHAASHQGSQDVINVMLEGGANFLHKDNAGCTPEALAKRGNHYECAEALALATWQYAMGRWKSKFEEEFGAGADPVQLPMYGPFHTFEIAFGRTVPAGSSNLAPVDPHKWMGAGVVKGKKGMKRANKATEILAHMSKSMTKVPSPC